MSSKITEAIAQLQTSVTTLKNGVPALQESIDEKRKQITELRQQYFNTHKECVAGVWNIIYHRTNDHVRLAGAEWFYDNEDYNKVGSDAGNALFAAMSIDHDVDWVCYAELPSDTGTVQISFNTGEICIDIYNMSRDEVVQWITDYDIKVKTPGVDWQLEDLEEERKVLTEFRDTLIGAGIHISTDDNKEQTDD